MAILNFKPVLNAILVGSVLLSCNFAEASLVTNKFPMLTYAEQNVPTYDKPGGGQKGFISPGVALVYIKQIRQDGWAYGSYPLANGKRIYRWFQMRELQGYLDYKNTDMTVESDQIVFRTSAGNSRLGSLKKNDKVIVIAERGDSKKIIYRVGGGNEYKMGWLTVNSAVSDNGGGGDNSDNENGGNDDSNWKKLLKDGKVIVKGDLIITGNNSTVNQNKTGDNSQIYANDGEVNEYNVRSKGDTVIGTMNKDSHDDNSINIDNSQNDNSVTDNSINNSEIDNSVNKGAKINSENKTNSNNTTNSGNKNVANNGEPIKKEQMKEEQKLKIEMIPNPNVDKVLKNKNESNANKTDANAESKKK